MMNTASFQSFLNNKMETVVCDINMNFVAQRLNNGNIETFHSTADIWCHFVTTVTKILRLSLQTNERTTSLLTTRN